MARSFNGTTEHINVGSSSVFSPAVVSISAWVKLAADPSGHDGVIFGTVGNPGYNLNVFNGTDQIGFQSTNGGAFDQQIGGHLGTSSWNHVCGFHNSSQFGVYLNGTLSGPGASTFASFSSAGSSFLIGDNGGNNWLNGLIADVAVWNATLTATEVAGLARGMRPNRVRPNSLAAWWPVDGIQSPEPDLSGNKNNGTITGTALAFGPPFGLFTRQIVQPTPLEILQIFTLMPQCVT